MTEKEEWEFARKLVDKHMRGKSFVLYGQSRNIREKFYDLLGPRKAYRAWKEARFEVGEYSSEVARYRQAGYSQTEAGKLATWSIKHQMTPTQKTAAQILGKPLSTIFMKRERAKIKIGLETIKKQLKQAKREKQQAKARADAEARRKAEIRLGQIIRERKQLLKKVPKKVLRRLKEKIPEKVDIPLSVVPSVDKFKIKVEVPLKAEIPKRLNFLIPFFINGKVKHIKLKQITKGLFEGLEKKGFSKQRISGFTSLNEKQIDKLKGLSEKDRKGLKTISKLQREIVVGGLKEVEEHPEKIIVTSVLSAMAPGVIRGLGATPTAVKIFKRIPKSVKKKGAKAISRFLTGAYLTSAGIRVAKEPTPEARAQRFGRILVGEVAPFEIGTRFGVRGLLKQELQTEINKAVKGMSKTRQQAFKDYMKQAQTFGKYEPEARNIKLNNIESIKGTKAQNTIRSFLKGSKGNVIVGGSVAQTGQIKVVRKLGDMDLYIEKGSTYKFAKQLANKLTKAGVKRVSSIRGQVNIKGKKAVEFKNIDRLLTNIEQVTPVWSRAKSYIIKTPEGIRIQRIGMQVRRKVVAAFADPKRLKTGKYRKDLKDFKKISDQIFKNAVKKSKGAFFFKKKKLKQIEKVFKRKIPKVKVKKIKKAIIKRIIKKPRLIPKQLQKIRLESLEKARAKLKLLRKKKVKIKIKKIKPKKPIKKPKIKKPPKYPPKKKPPKRPPRVPYPPKKKPKKPPKYPIKKKRKPTKYPPVRKPPVRRPPKRPPRVPTKYPPVRKPPVRRPPKRPPRVPIPIRPPKRPPKKIPIIPIRIKRKKLRKPKLKVGYDVFGKRLKGRKIKGKERKVVWIKLNVKPLSKKNAQNRGAYAIDHSVARTFKIRRVRKVKKVAKITPKEHKHFKKTRKKYRAYKIRKGVKKPIVRKYIERKGKYLIDTRGEKRGLKLHRLARQLKGRPVKKIKKRVIKKPIKKTKIKIRKSITTKLKKSKVLSKRVTLGGSKGKSYRGRGRISKSIKKLKRKPSLAQLAALAKGRAKLKRMREGR